MVALGRQQPVPYQQAHHAPANGGHDAGDILVAGVQGVKRRLGARLRAIDAESQEREAPIACNVLNWMAELGMSASYSVA